MPNCACKLSVSSPHLREKNVLQTLVFVGFFLFADRRRRALVKSRMTNNINTRRNSSFLSPIHSIFIPYTATRKCLSNNLQQRWCTTVRIRAVPSVEILATLHGPVQREIDPNDEISQSKSIQFYLFPPQFYTIILHPIRLLIYITQSTVK